MSKEILIQRLQQISTDKEYFTKLKTSLINSLSINLNTEPTAIQIKIVTLLERYTSGKSDKDDVLKTLNKLIADLNESTIALKTTVKSAFWKSQEIADQEISLNRISELESQFQS
jgi:hypothetical protein